MEWIKLTHDFVVSYVSYAIKPAADVLHHIVCILAVSHNTTHLLRLNQFHYKKRCIQIQ